jgi:hypothetical protein
MIGKLKRKLSRRTQSRTPPIIITTMASSATRKPKQPSRTQELPAVAGLTAAEFSTSHVVQEYLCKTIQNATCTAQNPNACNHTHGTQQPYTEDQTSMTETSASSDQSDHTVVPGSQQPERDAELERLRIAAFMYQRMADSRVKQQIDTSKLGRPHEALGSHPPFSPSTHDAGESRPDNPASPKSSRFD